MQSINIEPEVRIDPNDYHNLIEGEREENILCAFLGLTINPNMRVTPEQFFSVYKTMVQYAYAGININTTVQKHLDGTKIIEEIRSLKGSEYQLLDRKICVKIARFLTNDNVQFCKELDNVFFKFEAELLVSQFMPRAKVVGSA